jgi:hypothetical protein
MPGCAVQEPVVVIPLAEYLEHQTRLDVYRRMRTIYTQECKRQHARLMTIAEKRAAVSPKQIANGVEVEVQATHTKNAPHSH